MSNISPQPENMPALTGRQTEVLRLRAKEYTIDEIATELVITHVTVKKHLSAIYEKLGVSDDSVSTFDRLRAVQQYAAWLDEQAEPPRDAVEPEADDTLSPRADLILLWDEMRLQHRQRYAIHPVVTSIPEPIPIPDPIPISLPPRRNFRPLVLVYGTILLVALLGGMAGGALLNRVGAAGQPATKAGIPPAVSPARPESGSMNPVAAVVPVTSTAVVTHTAVAAEQRYCGEAAPQEYVVQPEFNQHQGVVIYSQENSGGALASNFVRTLAVGSEGLWMGYFSAEAGGRAGLGFTDRKQWVICDSHGGPVDWPVNDILVDSAGMLWVGTDGGGVFRYDGASWQFFTREDGLPSLNIFGLALDPNGQVWAGTWEGAAVYVDGRWETAYSRANNTLRDNQVHALAFDAQQNIWVGHIDAGVSQYDNALGTWVYYTRGAALGGSDIRDILVRAATDQTPESVWFATADGGISRFEHGEWTIYTTAQGLPDNHVSGLAVDRYQRIWAATGGGVSYFDGSNWVRYHTLPATAIAIGPTCEECPVTDDMVFTSTFDRGITYSRLPLDSPVIDVLEVRVPAIVAPGEAFYPEVVVAPRAPYQLREDRGDMLAHVDAQTADRFGAWTHMAVKGTVQAGEPFGFADYDNPFVAPPLAAGETERTYTSTWRVWMHTRLVGPPIEISFTVKQP